MKIAVTGASGFVGRHVIRELTTRPGIEVVACSRTGVGDSVALDIAAPDQKASFDRLGRPDAVIHLAWSGLPNYKALHHFETHLAQQYHFLSALVRAGLGSLTCVGTCLEYGMRSGEVQETMVTDPTTPYGFGKDALRRQLQLLRVTAPFELTWARLFYMFGEGQQITSLYPQVLAAMARGDRSFRMSRGEQLRDFLPVELVAKTIVALAIDAPGAGIVNVCSGVPVSVRSQVERWVADRHSDMQLELGCYPYLDYEPMAFWGSNARLGQVMSGNEAVRT